MNPSLIVKRQPRVYLLFSMGAACELVMEYHLALQETVKGFNMPVFLRRIGMNKLLVNILFFAIVLDDVCDKLRLVVGTKAYCAKFPPAKD